jgi:parallel beta-helix repeat protein
MKFLLYVFLLLFPVMASAGEGGVLRLHDHTFNTDQTWSGTVLIDGVVQFAPEATLTIMPGTKVMFTKTDTDGDGIGENEIYIQGRLVAKGTKESPVVFTSAEEKKRPGDWGAVNIMVSEGKVNELSGCVIEYGYRGFHMHYSKATLTDSTIRENFLGIQCQESELTVKGCEIRDNHGAIVFKDSHLKILNNVIADNYWGIRFLYGDAEIAGNTITGTLINGITSRENTVRVTGNVIRGNRKGFSAEQADVELTDNFITGSDESGVYLKHSSGTVSGNEITGNGNAGVSIEDSDVRIAGNDIYGNTTYGIDNNGTMDVDARGNWWGNADPAAVPAMLYDKARDASLGRVEYAPAATGPVAVRLKAGK